MRQTLALLVLLTTGDALRAPTIHNAKVSSRRAALLLAGAATIPSRATCTAIGDADEAYAVAEIIACREYLRAVTNLARSKAFAEARPALNKPPFSSVGAAADQLASRVDGIAEQKVALATSLQSLASALGAEDGKLVRAASQDAAQALDAMIVLLTTAGYL